MSRCEVVQVRCDRCKRVQLVPPQQKKGKPDFEAKMVGPDGKDTVLTYEDTCSYCKSALANIWLSIKEWERAVTQQFGPTVPEGTAVPLTPAPDYTPPKPHSVSASKK